MARLVRGYEFALMRAPISTTGAVAAVPNPQDHVPLAKSTNRWCRRLLCRLGFGGDALVQFSDLTPLNGQKVKPGGCLSHAGLDFSARRNMLNGKILAIALPSTFREARLPRIGWDRKVSKFIGQSRSSHYSAIWCDTVVLITCHQHQPFVFLRLCFHDLLPVLGSIWIAPMVPLLESEVSGQLCVSCLWVLVDASVYPWSKCCYCWKM